MSTFLFKTTPYSHQLTALERSHAQPYHALLMSMRTGKSKVILDDGVAMYAKSLIDAIVILAPNGVHRNWINNEIPAHLPDSVEHLACAWAGNTTKKQIAAWERLFKADSIPLRIITINYDAIVHDKGWKQLTRILSLFRCMLVLDESHRIKTPTAKRTRAVLSIAKRAKYRRILTGTFLTQGPLDAYTQLKFLDDNLPGYSTFTAFRAHYALIDPKLLGAGRIKLNAYLKRQGIDTGMYPVTSFASPDNLRKAGCRPGRDYFDEITGYQNLDQLFDRIADYATVVRAEDCVDLPPKIYETLPVELTAEQKRIYNDLLDESVAYLANEATRQPPAHMSPAEVLMWFMAGEGGKVAAANALSKSLRLQQVVGGFATTEEGDIRAIKSNRLKALLALIDGIDSKVIIWARFKPELTAIYTALRKQYGDDSTVRYHGSVGADERDEAVRRLEADDACRFFVGNAQSGGIGLPLHAADTMIYYSKDFNLDTYLQSEERASKVGKGRSVLIVDVQATDTLDARISAALATKREQADNFYDGLVEAGAGL